MKDNVYFLSGLPRTGSTLLTSILNQNPNIHTEGNSALCQLMWDLKVSCENTEQIKNKQEMPNKLLSALPHLFYENNDKKIIDKCRSWTLPANLELIDNYITKTPKIIIMLRPIVEIVKSFVFIRKMNGWGNPEEGLLDEGSEPIMRSLEGVKHTKSINSGQFAYYWYDDLINKPEATINSMYNFCGWNNFKHQYDDIKNLTPEKDDVINLVGLHNIRPTISRRSLDITLSNALYQKAIAFDKELNNILVTY